MSALGLDGALLMTDQRSKIGVIASVVCLAFTAYLLVRDPTATSKMTPNEWGDFFAGAFAPLAFLWLVLGYLQQGEELRLSTKALLLQADELRNSVEQQRELVEVSRQQVAGEREALAYERHLREEMSKPLFSVAGAGGIFGGDGKSTYNIVFSNTGHSATSVTADVQLTGSNRLRVLDIPLFDKGAQHRVSITHPTSLKGVDSRVYLRFTDGLGRPIEQEYIVRRENESPHAGLTFLRIEA